MIDIFDNSDSPKEPEKGEEKRRAAAVALQNQFSIGAPPIVTAAGYGEMAEKILQLAFENGVKVREDADLAELLATMELESEIPSEALIAVAEILAYVYKANGINIEELVQPNLPPENEQEEE